MFRQFDLLFFSLSCIYKLHDNMSCIEKDLGLCFLMRVGDVRCFGVQLRVISPY
jgi:hypothetical protein